jgi:hypothetical protein
MRRMAIALGLLTCVACHNAPRELPGAPSSSSVETPFSPSLAAAAPPVPGERIPSGSAPVLSGPLSLTFVSGESQLPVAAARVTTDVGSYVTDGAGVVAVERVTTLSVEASGFLERRALARADRFSLWPRVSATGLDEETTARLVYNCAAPACADGGEPLGRVNQGTVTLVPSRDLAGDRGALGAIDEAAHLWTAATRGEVVFVLGPPSATGTIVDIDVDPADTAIVSRGAAGVTRRQYSGAAIVRARITLRSVELARRLPLNVHEIGHAFGLGHSPRLGDVMWSGPELYDARDLSGREKLAVTLMLQRSSGNRYPDTESGVGTMRGSSSRRTSIVTCFER